MNKPPARFRVVLVLFILCCVIVPIAFAGAGAPPPDPARTAAAGPAGTAVLCGKLLTMDARKTVINGAVVLIRDGKFAAVGPEEEIEIPEGFSVIDARDRWVLPGLVDFHSHVGGDLGDLNDGVYLTNTGLRTLETLTPNNEYVQDARAAGITSLLLIPGSGNNMSGFGTLIKTAGRTIKDIVIKAPGVIKIAQAGNPERYWYGVGRAFMNWNLRTSLEILRDYDRARTAWEEGKRAEEPPFNPEMEEFRGCFHKKFASAVHTQAYQVMINTMTMLWDTFRIWCVMDHCTFDGYKTAPLMAKRGIVCVCGPRNIWLDRQDRRINGVPAKYSEGGVTEVGTNTDAPVVPIEEHFFQAAIGVHMGWDNTYRAIEGLVRVTAHAGLIDDRVGSVEPGKDADLAFFNGDPLDPRCACVLTVVNGKVVYDAARDGQRY